jgi:hypothetical protein
MNDLPWPAFHYSETHRFQPGVVGMATGAKNVRVIVMGAGMAVYGLSTVLIIKMTPWGVASKKG